MKENFNRQIIYRITFTAAMGGFLFGYDTAVISGAISSLETFFIEPYHYSQSISNVLLGFMVSGALLGCIVNCSKFIDFKS